jgi:hypothetical protein
MDILIGIDDTDDAQSRGTGFRARSLGALLGAQGLGRCLAVTRHQLLVAPEIPCTSNNSTACLLVEAAVDEARLIQETRDFLLRESAARSDVGLCVAAWDAIGADVIAYGQRVKREIVAQADARDLASRQGLHLEGLTGTQDGVIGALAAVGLRRSGDDGRFVWLGDLRALSGVHTVAALRRDTGIDEVRTLDGAVVPPSARVDVGPWVRPVLLRQRAVLLVEPAGDCDYRVAAKELIKARSN